MEQSFAPDLFTDWFGCAKDKIKQKIRLSKKIAEGKNYDVFSRNVSWCSINRTDREHCAVYNRSFRCYISSSVMGSCISFIRLLVTPGDSIIFIHKNNDKSQSPRRKFRGLLSFYIAILSPNASA